MKKVLIIIIYIAAFLLLTFFGLGPVLYADGTTNERIITAIIVAILYVILFASFYWIKKKL